MKKPLLAAKEHIDPEITGQCDRKNCVELILREEEQ